MKKQLNDLKELFKINLLYLGGKNSRLMIERQRKKGKEDKSIYKSILLSQIAAMLFMTGLYIFIMVPFPLDLYPKYFDNMAAFMLILGIIQSYTMFYNILYESKDMESYLPLPLEPRLIYISKLIAIILGSFIFVLPISGMASALMMKLGISLWMTILMFFYTMIVSSCLFVLVNIFIMEFLIRSGLVKLFSRKIMNYINIIMQFSMIGIVIWIQLTSTKIDFEQIETGTVEYGFLSQFLAPDGKTWVFFAITLGIILLTIISIYYLGKNFREQFLILQQSSPKRKKSGKSELQISDRRMSIIKYKLSLITDASVISQSLLFPIMFMLSPFLTLFNMSEDLSSRGAGMVFLLFSITMPLILSGVAYNLPELMISLDNENYEFLKTMPMDRREYVILSGLVGGVFSAIIPFIGLLVICFILKINIIYIILGLFIFTVHHLLLSVKNTLKDEQDPLIGWQSLTEVFNRDGKYLIVFKMLGYLLLLEVIVFLGIYFMETLIGQFDFYYLMTGAVVISLFLGVVYYARLEKQLNRVDF